MGLTMKGEDVFHKKGFKNPESVLSRIGTSTVKKVYLCIYMLEDMI